MSKIVIGGYGAAQNKPVPWLVAGYRINKNRSRKVRHAIAFAMRKNQKVLVLKNTVIMH